MPLPLELAVDPATLAILALVAFVAGFIDAIAGGGGLLTIPALLMAGLPPHLVLGTNKLNPLLLTCLVGVFQPWGFRPDWKELENGWSNRPAAPCMMGSPLLLLLVP
mgnify:CR=1 FL=1